MLCKKHTLDSKDGKLLTGDDEALGEGLQVCEKLRNYSKHVASPLQVLLFFLHCVPNPNKLKKKKVCVQKQTLNHFANPTLDFTFLQWGSHSFIQIPKVEIICSKCFQSRPAEGPNDFSRAGENCEIFYTLMEHSKWKKERETNEGKGQRNVLMIYLFILLQLWLFDKPWGDTLIANVLFPLAR